MAGISFNPLSTSLPFPFTPSQTPTIYGISSRNIGSFSNRSRIRIILKSTDQDNNFSSADSIEVRPEKGGFSGNGASASSSSFLSFLCPLLKLFSSGDPSQERVQLFEVAASSLSSLARFPWGSKSISDAAHTEKIGLADLPMPLQLFEFGKACPFCRRVREALTELDLAVEVYPCPKGSMRHREIAKRSGGKEQFPFLIDPNTGVSMYESGEIVKYLFFQYGNRRNPSFGLLESTLFTGWMPTIIRAGRGMTLWEKASREPPPKMLELFSYENNPYARIVREALCELELPYILQNVGEGSSRLKLLFEASGSNEVPYLVDPNTGTNVGDYKKILAYLFKTYSIDSLLS
ncbi:hypothetical protein AKJ16_DCAP10352 [Drosera capensis]